MIRRALLAALALMLLVPVFAEGTMTPLRMTRGGDRVPTARIAAEGTGSIKAIGRMAVWGTIPAKGLVTVVDREGDAKAWLTGQAQEFTDGPVRTLKIRPAAGYLYVAGSDVSVTVVGVRLAFNIAGNGRAQLSGSGTYTLNSGEERSWSRAWITVAPPSSERKRFRRCTNCASSATPLRSRR